MKRKFLSPSMDIHEVELKNLLMNGISATVDGQQIEYGGSTDNISKDTEAPIEAEGKPRNLWDDGLY